jgi:hypothetical protein
MAESVTQTRRLIAEAAAHHSSRLDDHEGD